jgi:chromosome segregation ATPase
MDFWWQAAAFADHVA